MPMALVSHSMAVIMPWVLWVVRRWLVLSSSMRRAEPSAKSP